MRASARWGILSACAVVFGCQADRTAAPPAPAARGQPEVAPAALTSTAAPAAAALTAKSLGGGPMDGDRIKALKESKDPKELLAAGLEAARSAEPADHALLQGLLTSAEFLGRLDSKEEYQQAAKFRLRASRVVDALGRNAAPSARQAFVAVCQDKGFLAEDERIIALLQASAFVRPAPPELAKFWDDHFQPEDGFGPTAVTAMVDNGSPEALALLEKKFADRQFEDDEKLAWMRTRILAHRNDLPLLEWCERVLKGSLPKGLRPALVEVLFDYRPGEWFRPATVVAAPDRRKASAEALAVLRRIGEYALQSVPLSANQKKAVEGTLTEIDKQLK